MVRSPDHSAATRADAEFFRSISHDEHLMRVLAACDELATHLEVDVMLRHAVELARNVIGLERVAIYVRDLDGETPVLRGTWGTGPLGQTTDEHELVHPISRNDSLAFCELNARGFCGVHSASAPWSAAGRSDGVSGAAWSVATPLVAGRQLIGVMYNDAALSGAPLDEAKQVCGAILCRLLASLFASRRGSLRWAPSKPDAGCSARVRRVLEALRQDPCVSGEAIARHLGISAGHLARSFKREMGLSLVEYRNKLRLDRFSSALERGNRNLLDAALAAGFGSYAQFHRVHRQLLGTTPKEYWIARAAPR